MLLQEAMKKLESLGTEQTRKTYRRHGAGENVFGVLFGELRVLARSIKRDHKLACQLWETGNFDARSLATMILDPKQLDEQTASIWVGKLDTHCSVSLLAGCIAQSNFAHKVIYEWLDSENEFARQSGYYTLAHMLKSDGNSVTDDECRKILDRIEKELKAAPDQVRYSMNGALIAVGIYKPELTDVALKCADRIGKVEVDHGDTSCKTPDARAYILKALSRKSQTANRKPKAKVAAR